MTAQEENSKRRIYIYFNDNGDLMYSGHKDINVDAYHFHFYHGPIKRQGLDHLLEIYMRNLKHADKMKKLVRKEVLRHMMFLD